LNGKKSFFLLLAALLVSAVIPTNVAVASPTAKIYVDPPVKGAAPGEFFTVDIKISDVTGLYSYDLILTWEPAILDVTSVTEGTFLSRDPRAYQTFSQARINNTMGWIYFTCTVKGDILAAAASSSGKLATVKFQVKAIGGTVLDLRESFDIGWPPLSRPTKLRDYYLESIPYTLEDGYFVYPTPKLFVDPPDILDPTLLVGTSFSINISVIDAEGLHGWSLHLRWDPALLNITNAVEGPFLNSSGATVFLPPEIDQEAGNVYLNCTLEGANGVAGNGTLATITFLVKMLGSTNLELYTTKLLDVNLAQMPHVIEGSYFNNKLHNVAIVSVEVSQSEVEAGDSMSVTVVAKNKGSVTEGFDVKVWANYTLVGTQAVSDLAPDVTQTLAFSWNTKDVAEGLYQIKAEATTVSEEVDITDNEYTDGTVKVTSSGQQFSSTFIIAIIIAVAAIGIAIFFYVRRKKSS